MAKKKIKQDENVTDAGLVLDAEQAAMVRKQTYEGSYSLGAPTVATTADGAVVTVKSVAYTVHGDSPITTVVSYPPEDAVNGYRPYCVPSLQDLVRQAIEGARHDAEAVIEAVNEEWEANVGPFDDEDEGLREAAAFPRDAVAVVGRRVRRVGAGEAGVGMTCIVGVAEGGRVYIGGDSAGVDGRYGLTVRADRKVFKNGPMIMGFTSSFRMGQLLHHALKVPRRHPDDGIENWMVTDFVDAVRTSLKAGGYAESHNGAEQGGEFLVGYEGRLFTIQADYQVAENVDGYAACGCGDLIALGALHALGPTVPPEDRVQRALDAAERFSGGVRGPFHVETLGDAPSPEPAKQVAA